MSCESNGTFAVLARRIVVILTVFLMSAGCSDRDELQGRVALEVTVRLGEQLAGEGTLILRPQPGVRCPLITVPVVDGRGQLPRSRGPVPGGYRVGFRPAAVAESITEHLTRTGRVEPQNSSRIVPGNRTVDGQRIPLPKADIELTIPASDPAVVSAEFEIR